MTSSSFSVLMKIKSSYKYNIVRIISLENYSVKFQDQPLKVIKLGKYLKYQGCGRCCIMTLLHMNRFHKTSLLFSFLMPALFLPPEFTHQSIPDPELSFTFLRRWHPVGVQIYLHLLKFEFPYPEFNLSIRWCRRPITIG